MIWTGAGVVITVCLQGMPALLYAMICNHLNALLLRLHVTWATMVTAGTETTACQKALYALLHATPLSPPCVLPQTWCVTWGWIPMAAGWEIIACQLDLSAQLVLHKLENECFNKS